MWKTRPLGELLTGRKPPLSDLPAYPTMTRWFAPTLLGKLFLKVVISDVFKQYADRRLIEAAMDPAPKQELQARDDLTGKLRKDAQGAVWIDYTADMGDGFDATYAIAYLITRPELTLDGMTLPRGGALFFGGDEVYPTSSKEEYNVKLRAPYQFAFPDIEGAAHPPVFAIPGNHDWYDGLVNFLAVFARAKPTRVGNYRTQQRRSYFAAKLTESCWLWAVDIALVADMDQPQADYFVAVAEGMPQGASIILCSAEPGWYRVESNAYRTLSYAAWIAENAGRALKIPLVLSGDSHHYSRYEGESGTQYVTSGGGGAFLHGTHQLPETIEAEWLRRPHEKLTLKGAFPSAETSRRLLWRNLLFPFSNATFSLASGAVFALFGFVLSLAPRTDLAVVLFVLLAFPLVAYTTYQEKARTAKVIAFSSLYALVQFAAMLALTCALVQLDAQHYAVRGQAWWLWLVVFGIPMTIVGGLVSGFLSGLNLIVTCRLLGLNNNDAFGAMHLDTFRHFLRIRIAGDRITIFPIGFARTPQRSEWRDNPAAATDPTAAYFLPPEGFAPLLVEQPVVFSGRAAEATTDVKKPGELPQ